MRAGVRQMNNLGEVIGVERKICRIIKIKWRGLIAVSWGIINFIFSGYFKDRNLFAFSTHRNAFHLKLLKASGGHGVWP